MSAVQASNALPANYRLDEYVIQRVLGIGGFGITYLAQDTRLGALVAIKEYFPQAYAHREHTQTIRPTSQGDTGDAENYRWGLEEFLKEARALAQFKHTNIVRVLRYLEANGTAYMVMEYEEGESLYQHLAHHGGFLAEPVLLNIFLPVLTGLQAVHDAGLLHLDIKPDNIYLRRTGQPMLIDFGAARQRQSASRGEKVALTPGYAALEQYPGCGEAGTWSDVYSIGATLYRCITGKEPMDARERARGLKRLHVDPLIPATRFDRPHYSTHIRTCVDAATVLRADERPKSAFALQNGLMGKEMAEKPKVVADNAYSRGPGFLGVVDVKDDGKPRRRIIPRGPLERLVVSLVFVAVLIVAPVQIMLALGQLTEDQLYDHIDRLQVAAVDHGKRSVRYVEETVFGITRPPEYTPTPAASRNDRPAAAPKAKDVPVPPFETRRKQAGNQTLSAAAMSLAYLKDGQLLAVALDTGAIELRNADSGALTRQFSPANGVSGVVASSPDGKRLALSAGDGEIQLWDMERNVFLAELGAHVDRIIALVFSPDGKRLASAGRDQSALLWDADSGQLLHDLSKPKNEPLALAFSPDGKRLAVGDSGGGIRYWELENVRDIAYVPTRDQPITALAYSPDGKWFAVGTEQGYLGLWDVSGKRTDRALEAAPEIVHALTFSPDSQWLLVAGSDTALQLWSVETGELAERYAGGNHQTYALALAPEGRQFAAAGVDRKLTLWR
jgi:serine/threonine protein kinase